MPVAPLPVSPVLNLRLVSLVALPSRGFRVLLGRQPSVSEALPRLGFLNRLPVRRLSPVPAVPLLGSNKTLAQYKGTRPTFGGTEALELR